MRDYTGKKFNHLTMISYVRAGGRGVGSIWITRCDCGNVQEKYAKYVTSGRVKTCGKCQLTRKLKQVYRALDTKNIRKKYLSHIMRATREGVKFELSYEEFDQYKHKSCYMCGADNLGCEWELVRSGMHTSYTLEECVLVCRDCSSISAKPDMQKYINHILKIHRYLNLHNIT